MALYLTKNQRPWPIMAEPDPTKKPGQRGSGSYGTVPTTAFAYRTFGKTDPRHGRCSRVYLNPSTGRSIGVVCQDRESEGRLFTAEITARGITASGSGYYRAEAVMRAILKITRQEEKDRAAK